MARKSADKITSFLNNTEKPINFHVEPLSATIPFTDFGSLFADNPDTVILASGGKSENARYHMLAANPWFQFSFKDRYATLTEKISNQTQKKQTNKTRTLKVKTDPFWALKQILECCRLDNTYKTDMPLLKTLPVFCGLFGYFSYDLKNYIEKLPQTIIDEANLPDLYLIAPKLLIVHDTKTNERKLIIPEFSSTGAAGVNTIKNAFYKHASEATVSHNFGSYYSGTCTRKNSPGRKIFNTDNTLVSPFISTFTQKEYEKAVKKVIDYITQGDVYQVNISQRFEKPYNAHPYVLFTKLLYQNPAPFYAYINGGHYHIISTSPERFIKRAGPHIKTQPIKGTRPRGKTPLHDRQNRQELIDSKKDDAELSMIVDLLRNDLGKVCKGGSIRVKEHKRVEAYKNVFHLVSTVTGTVKNNTNSADIIRAAFPGGSITGCPKIRAMEIIDRIEPVKRHIYTGSIGYISFHDTMDLSIAIRTATITNNTLYYSAGGGIVYDSDPTEEYCETLAKAETMLKTEGKPQADPDKKYVWLNGKLKNEENARIPLTAPGFQYGAGLFETIRVNNGMPCYLNEHITRLETSWEKLFRSEPPCINWGDVISQVIDVNNLGKSTSAVKLIAAPGPSADSSGNLQKAVYAVTARPYTHRLETIGKRKIDLAVYPNARSIETANHKTLNYLYYLTAGNWAKEHGADEALILNADHTVSETNTANILVFNGKLLIQPQSDNVLPGIMQNAVISLLFEWGYSLSKEKITVEECKKADFILLTNSLMGAVAVNSIDGHTIGTENGNKYSRQTTLQKEDASLILCKKLNSTLL